MNLRDLNDPSQLKNMSIKELTDLSTQIRQFILNSVSQTGGHLSSNLGTVELTVALHKVFNSPKDKIIFDVGHQSYTHKILTGRREKFYTLRQKGGLSGFQRRNESEHDPWEAGHSSTSISAALGMAIAAKMSGEESRQSIAVIGDGAMTGGMAFEALNNAGVYNSNLLVILNDNNMAIDPNVGGLNEYLLDITTSKGYNKIKQQNSSFPQKSSGQASFYISKTTKGACPLESCFHPPDRSGRTEGTVYRSGCPLPWGL